MGVLRPPAPRPPAPRRWTLAGVSALVLAMAACTGQVDPAGDDDTDAVASAGDASAGEQEEPGEREIVIWAGTTEPMTPEFDPFSPVVLPGVSGLILEPLFAYNQAADTDRVPLLATDAEFNDDGTELTITIRGGVEWNDGEPFSGEDVVFTFLSGPARPAALDSAEVAGERTVRLVFSTPQFTQEAQILETLILPRHVWEDLGNEPPAPVGTGPYVVGEVTRDYVAFDLNENSWHEAGPEIAHVRYLSLGSEEEAENLLAHRELDWAAVRTRTPRTLTAEGHLSMFAAAQDPTVVYTCANADLGCTGPQVEPAVRRAIHLAIERTELIGRAFAGNAGASSPALIVPGRDDHWAADPAAGRNPAGANPQAARDLLEEAGYTPGPAGIYERDGQPLEIDIAAVEEWTDHASARDLIVEQVREAGIGLQPVAMTPEEFAEARDEGHFELMIGGIMGTRTPDPYEIYARWLGGQATAPVGEGLPEGGWNVSRYSEEDVDEAIRAATFSADPGDRLEAYGIIQARMSQDLPYISLLTTRVVTFYNSADFTGWPTRGDPYMFPAPWSAVSAGVILTALRVA